MPIDRSRLFTVSLAAILLMAVAKAEPPFRYQRVMIPMRDGVRLETVILTPTAHHGPLPILLKRSPYGVPAAAPLAMPSNLAALERDGYVIVVQNLRGRFGSEGEFLFSSKIGRRNAKAVDEATDSYDTVEWLIHNVKLNNGRVGLYGVSYSGMTAAIASLRLHPAVAAIDEQAAPADQWMNDDFHRFGALRLSYSFEYSVLLQKNPRANTLFDFDVHDLYEWYLRLGAISNINDKYLHRGLPHWNAMVDHPDYDRFWREEAWTDQLRGANIPILSVAGFWDQEDPAGPWTIFRKVSASGGAGNAYLAAGPWYHAQWLEESARAIGPLEFGGHDTAQEFREQIEAPFLRYYLHGSGIKPSSHVVTFQTGTNRWMTYDRWPPQPAHSLSIFLQTDGSLSFSSPGRSGSFREYVSDPADPVPYRARPISPTYPGGDWDTWQTDDQRFVDRRPDVLTYVSPPLTHDVVATGAMSAEIYASTTGTDGDLIVKLIDVFPENVQKPGWKPDVGPATGQYAHSLNGYEFPIAMEVRRGRYLNDPSRPQPLAPDKAELWRIPLGDRDHVFLKGHRIMVQIQSTWFPLIDRNPQTFVPDIAHADAKSFRPARERIFSSALRPSRILIPFAEGGGANQ